MTFLLKCKKNKQKLIGIYKITNPSGKIYIGQSVNILRRWSEYKSVKYNDKGVLFESFKKHGTNNHVFEVIEECEINELNNRERYWQDHYDVCNSKKGLNCKLTKTNEKSGKCSLETIEKIRLASKGNNSNSKKIIDKSNGIVYNSIKEVSFVFKLSYKVLSMRLTGYYKNNTTFEFLEKYNKMELKFGIPNLKQKKQEKYNNVGVLTILPTGEGLGRKMELNAFAIKQLGLTDKDNQVSFSFQGDTIYIVNTSNSGIAGFKIGKTTNGFSDKKHYEYIKGKIFKMPESDSLELFFNETENEFNGNKVFQLTKEFNTTNFDKSFEKLDEEVDKILEKEEAQSPCCGDDSCGSPCTNHELMPDEYQEDSREYTQEELDAMNSHEYARQIEVEAEVVFNEDRNFDDNN